MHFHRTFFAALGSSLAIAHAAPSTDSQQLGPWTNTNMGSRALASPNEDLICSPIGSQEFPALVRRKHSGYGGIIYLTLINGTPYTWHRDYAHSYQMADWKQESPATVRPGEAVQFTIQPSRGIFKKTTDSGGELIYRLQGTLTPMSFELTYNHNKRRHRWEAHVRFHGNLTSLYTQKEASTMIGSSQTWFVQPNLPNGYGGVPFLLAGTEKEGFISTTDVEQTVESAGWMQAMLPHIGHRMLREIIVPRSHHAALHIGDSTSVGVLGVEKYAITQTRPLAEQLRRDGVRVLDTRVAKFYAKRTCSDLPLNTSFVEFHGFKSDIGLQGVAGNSLPQIIDVINQFNDENPGEMIIWEFHENTFVHDRRNSHTPAEGLTRDLSQDERMEIFDMLKQRLNHRANLSAVANGFRDYTQVPLQRFIGSGKSAVLVIFADSWKRDVSEENFPSAEEGIITRSEFPYTGRWADTDNVVKMAINQLSQMKQLRRQPTDKLFDLQWILSLGTPAFLRMSSKDLITAARQSMVEFRRRVWTSMTTQSYPNWVTLDGIENGEMKTWAMAANLCFVAEKCGDWARSTRTHLDREK